MAQDFSASSDPERPPTNQGRTQSRRWWLIGGLAVALLLVGAAAAYAGTRFAEDPESSAAEPPVADPPSASPVTPPSFLEPPPTEPPPAQGGDFCWDVINILSDRVGVDLDYVENTRDIADRLRQLDAPTPTHQAALDDLVAELEAAADMVEDDPSAEGAASDRDDEAAFAFVDAGGCD